MVRWVFRPYTQFPQAICTLALLRTSIRVSPDFFLSKYSSPSFGSSSIHSNSLPVEKNRVNQYCLCCLLKHTFTSKLHLHSRYTNVTTPLSSQINETPWSVFQDGSIHHIHTITTSTIATITNSHPSTSTLKKAHNDNQPSVFSTTLNPWQHHRTLCTRTTTPFPINNAMTHTTHNTLPTVNCFQHHNFRLFQLFFQSSCQLSFTVLVCYRLLTSI